MGKIVISTNISLDGVIQDPDGQEGSWQRRRYWRCWRCRCQRGGRCARTPWKRSAWASR